jgi:hypothetical protein
VPANIVRAATSRTVGNPAWSPTTGHALDLFAVALDRMRAAIADADPTPWNTSYRAAAGDWTALRNAI